MDFVALLSNSKSPFKYTWKSCENVFQRAVMPTKLPARPFSVFKPMHTNISEPIQPKNKKFTNNRNKDVIEVSMV